jgi:hypothetical protein
MGGARAGGPAGGARAGGPVGGARAGGPAGGARAGGNLDRGRIGGGTLNPGIGMDGGTFDSESLIARDVPLVITQTETEIKIINTLKVKGENVPNIENYRLDGEEHEETIPFGPDDEAKKISKAKLNKNKIKIEITSFNPEGRKFLTNKEFSLSKDGKTLTLVVSMQSPFLLTSEKRVYEKE